MCRSRRGDAGPENRRSDLNDRSDLDEPCLTNTTVIDRRLRPRCCHLGSYFKCPKSSPVRPSACNWYYCAQLIANVKAASELRFSWAATSSNLGNEMIQKFHVSREFNALFTPPARHDKTVLSASCQACRCEWDNCSERVQTSNFLPATVLSCRGSNSHRRKRTRH